LFKIPWGLSEKNESTITYSHEIHRVNFPHSQLVRLLSELEEQLGAELASWACCRIRKMRLWIVTVPSTAREPWAMSFNFLGHCFLLWKIEIKY
jgi:hypothetical protein